MFSESSSWNRTIRVDVGTMIRCPWLLGGFSVFCCRVLPCCNRRYYCGYSRPLVVVVRPCSCFSYRPTWMRSRPRGIHPSQASFPISKETKSENAKRPQIQKKWLTRKTNVPKIIIDQKGIKRNRNSKSTYDSGTRMWIQLSYRLFYFQFSERYRSDKSTDKPTAIRMRWRNQPRNLQFYDFMFVGKL